jgi:hypothetical protein
MKDIFGNVGKMLSFIFAALVIGYTATLTYLLAGRLVPGNLLLQLMTVALFDGAALVWFIMFITQAKGTTQWAMSLIGWVVGLIGAVIMVAGELILGQSLVAFNDPTRLGWVLITTVIIACVVHVTLVYLFHLADPTVRNRIEIAQKISEKVERAYNDARKEIDRKQDALTAGLTDSIFAEAEQMLEGITAINVRNRNRREQENREVARDAHILPGYARDVPHMPPMTATPGGNGRNKQIHTKRGIFKRGSHSFNANPAPKVIVTAPLGVPEAHQSRPPYIVEPRKP